jgi:hypothetical protein
MNFLPEKKYGVPSNNFVKKNVLGEKGDEITRFDGTYFRINQIKKDLLHLRYKQGNHIKYLKLYNIQKYRQAVKGKFKKW